MTTMNNEDPADPSVHEPLISLEDIRGAVARGWCHPANEHKEMDSTLALAIADEVHAALSAAQQPALYTADPSVHDTPREAHGMTKSGQLGPCNRSEMMFESFTIQHPYRAGTMEVIPAASMREALAAERERSHELLQAADHIRAGLEAKLAALSAVLAAKLD